MSARELVVLGTASQVPTRHRNHNGYVLLWDGEGILFDPGEGTQRQMLHTAVTAHDLTRICVTHLHGDHCLGLPGVLQHLSLDAVPHPVTVHYPAGGQRYFERLRHATPYHDVATVRPEPVRGPGVLAGAGDGLPFTLEARALSHRIEAFGYRVVEPDGRRMLPERLAARGVTGPDVGRLQRAGELRGVRLEEVSERRPGQRFAFVMDTRLCDGVYELADGCDMLVIESTFLHAEAELAEVSGHMTAFQAGRVAAECGVRHLVLTHFSQRYPDNAAFAAEARRAGFAGELTAAEDLTRVPVPKRAA
ncbi:MULTISPECIES: ribonuclease Z [Streptomyces]|uniref:Ribonuclease Z n=1 Tax=Streptomyces cacaoi TaxID=1898 RepID=A0A4Y3R0F8_STRCI|nr:MULTISPECIES: ribonuclease Z [Streptomyces]NNG88075.1 ribonuclease Z [Streptomyces cacaoi]QHF93557.1 ribonuclease Z [Streptomyces sp. NHF165]GEB51166.1 ribonuclease Z [Streptomyces cacaoi]